MIQPIPDDELEEFNKALTDKEAEEQKAIREAIRNLDEDDQSKYLQQ